MIQYEQLKPYFELLSKIVYEMPFGLVKYSIKADLCELLPQSCGAEDTILPNMIDRANHAIKDCYHKKNDISEEKLREYVDKLCFLVKFYEVDELNQAIVGLQSVLSKQ